MSTASLRRHEYGLHLPLLVIVTLQRNGIDRKQLATLAVADLTKIGLSEAEATNALRIAVQKATQPS